MCLQLEEKDGSTDKCCELKASINTLSERISNPVIFGGEAEIRIAYFQERHQGGNLRSQMSFSEEDVRHSKPVSASGGNRPSVTTVKGTWYLSELRRALERPRVWEAPPLPLYTEDPADSLCEFTGRTLLAWFLFLPLLLIAYDLSIESQSRDVIFLLSSPGRAHSFLEL